LGVNFPRSATDAADCDAYARGLDLVATYAEIPERPFRLQAYWRCVETPVEGVESLLAFDLELSVQTPLLDCLPHVATVSAVRSLKELRPLEVKGAANDSGNTAGALSPGGFALQLEIDVVGQPWQYVEMIHAEDARGGRAEYVDGAWVIEQDLFEPGLEKGVIRRVRVRGLLHPGAPDGDLVQRAYQRFHGAALPLTT
jgi:hypothetical protein